MDYEAVMKEAGHVFRVEAIHVKDINGKPDFVEFFPYLEGFTENYDSNWNEEEVFGRMDGIPNFVGVKRSFSLSIKIAAGSLEQARENQFKLSKLIRFLYPSITPGSGGEDAYYFRGAPIIKLKFGSIINDIRNHGGLYGYIQGGLSITPSHQHGWFTPNKLVKEGKADDGWVNLKKLVKWDKADENRNPSDKLGAQEDSTTIFYKYFDISFTFKVLHNHVLGNIVGGIGEEVFEYFPYGVGKYDFANGSELNAIDQNPEHQFTPHEPMYAGQSSLPANSEEWNMYHRDIVDRTNKIKLQIFDQQLNKLFGRENK